MHRLLVHLCLFVIIAASSNTALAAGKRIAADKRKPKIMKVQTTSITASSAVINWETNEPATSQVEYGITQSYGSKTAINTTLTNSHEVILTSLAANTVYYYRARSKDAAGNESVSSGYSFKTTGTTLSAPPAAPTGLSAATASISSIGLTWTDNSGNEDGFKIEQSMDGNSFSQIATVGTNTTLYTCLNLNGSTTYYYRVRAYNSQGNSSYTNVANATTSSSGKAKAFPGAVGFGTDTPGGRGGAILKVTNLNDSGPGSLRAAVEASGARTVVFEISGTIQLQSELKIRNPYLTLAGQTAPSPGITLRAGELNIRTHDVLIQHIRIRVGDKLPSATTDIGGVDGISADGAGSYNVVMDHVSVSWGIDENASSWYDGVNDVTWSNCIISEALEDSIHPQGRHSMGLLVTPNGNRVAIIGNLLAHNNDRNPLISNGAEVVVANNVFYNWKGGRATNIGNTSSSISVDGPTYVSIVGNAYIAGLDTPSTTNAISTTSSLNSGSKVYYSNNVLERVANVFRNLASFNPVVSSPPIWIEGFTAAAGSTVESRTLSNAGARPADRDAVDERIINHVQSRSGRIIDSQSEVGGWPNLSVNYRSINVGSNPNGDNDGDGYTNFEEEVLFPMAAQVEGKS